jgi:hypothetical protein
MDWKGFKARESAMLSLLLVKKVIVIINFLYLHVAATSIGSHVLRRFLRGTIIVKIADNIAYQRRVLGEKLTSTNSLIFIVPGSAMTFVLLSVHVMLMGGYKHP